MSLATVCLMGSYRRLHLQQVIGCDVTLGRIQSTFKPKTVTSITQSEGRNSKIFVNDVWTSNVVRLNFGIS
ncbi:Uncharacterized protein HZ326_10707 [Fusarium oxysporum f. sp. albedinis]|nr:Uncharacterized protein HZ326_10707 [Fusarium oxysporum f. sp. albedinis]